MHRQVSDCSVALDRLIFSQLHQPTQKNVLTTILNLNSLNSHLLDCQVSHHHLHSNIYGYCLLVFAKSHWDGVPCLGHRQSTDTPPEAGPLLLMPSEDATGGRII